MPRKSLNLNNRRLIGFAASLFMTLMPLPLLAKKAYEGTYMKVTRTWINKNGVRFIEGRGDGLAFILSGTPKSEKHCTAPSLPRAYLLYAPSDDILDNACDNYLLGSASIESGGIPVCLDSVEPTP